MTVIQFFQYLFHDGFTEEDCLCAHTKLLAILIYCFHLLVIQINDLPVMAHKRCLLFLEIFGVNPLGYFLFTGHNGNDKMNISENLCKGSNFYRICVSLP